MRKFIYLSIFVLLLLSLGKGVSAVDSKLTISPSVLRVIAKPGTTPTIEFTLSNQGDPALIKVSVVPFQPLDNLGRIRLGKEVKGSITFRADSSSSSLNQTVLLKSGSHQLVSLNMNISSDTPEKDYYFSLVAETAPFPAPEGETTLRFANRIGANMLVSVTADGRLEKKLDIPLFQSANTLLNKPIYDNFDKIPLTLVIKNNGRNVIKPEVSLLIQGWNVHKKYLLPVVNILSFSQRVVMDNTTILDGFYAGKYTITASVKAGEGAPTVLSRASFYAFPYKLLIGAAVLIFLFLFLSKKRKP